MKKWITKYALTTGRIFEAEVLCEYGHHLAATYGKVEFSDSYLTKSQMYDDLVAAVTHANKQRVRKIVSLTNSIRQDQIRLQVLIDMEFSTDRAE